MKNSIKYVTAPDGSVLTMADLPCVATQRWTIAKKGAIVAAVNGGLLSLAEACQRYRLTVDEFASWADHYKTHGLAGLRVTRIQQYRA